MTRRNLLGGLATSPGAGDTDNSVAAERQRENIELVN